MPLLVFFTNKFVVAGEKHTATANPQALSTNPFLTMDWYKSLKKRLDPLLITYNYGSLNFTRRR